MPRRSLADLRRAAEVLGYESREQVQAVLEAAGAGGSFDPDRFPEYVAALAARAQAVEEIVSRVEYLDAVYALPPCPVCGAEARRSRDLDRVYGAVEGWTCSVGGRSHFIQARWDLLKPFLVKGRSDRDS